MKPLVPLAVLLLAACSSGSPSARTATPTPRHQAKAVSTSRAVSPPHVDPRLADLAAARQAVAVYISTCFAHSRAYHNSCGAVVAGFASSYDDIRWTLLSQPTLHLVYVAKTRTVLVTTPTKAGSARVTGGQTEILPNATMPTHTTFSEMHEVIAVGTWTAATGRYRSRF